MPFSKVVSYWDNYNRLQIYYQLSDANIYGMHDATWIQVVEKWEYKPVIEYIEY